jgi:excinuclease ABC subunit C
LRRKVSKTEYQHVIKNLVGFCGKHDLITRDIKKRMEMASEGMNFEVAARLRDQIKAIEAVTEGQRVL